VTNKPLVPPAAPAKRGNLMRTVAPLAPLAIALVAGQAMMSSPPVVPRTSAGVLTPLLSVGQPVDWWFVFKLNAGSFPACADSAQQACPFGGTVHTGEKFGQQFAYASSSNHTLQKGGGCLGDAATDPVGATFDQVYNGHFFYVIWNDQFDGDPMNTKGAPGGHSKGVLAWDNAGGGLVMQVSTPSWPASGSAQNPRKSDGNTLGCTKDNDILVSQHFFSLKLNKDDVVSILKAIQNASVVTDPKNPQIVNNGGPPDIQDLAASLGKVSPSNQATKTTLSTGVQVISKPSKLEVPPWQMVSAMLGGESIRVASWWSHPEIPSTTAETAVGCWDSSLGKPGAVEIATSGTWMGRTIGLEGMPEPDGNHAKVGVSTGTHTYAIFGDMNQQGSLSPPKCDSSQNGRGGLFYVIDDKTLAGAVTDLIKGESAPAAPASKSASN
jgi:Deoxyribonuclease II